MGEKDQGTLAKTEKVLEKTAFLSLILATGSAVFDPYLGSARFFSPFFKLGLGAFLSKLGIGFVRSRQTTSGPV